MSYLFKRECNALNHVNWFLRCVMILQNIISIMFPLNVPLNVITFRHCGWMFCTFGVSLNRLISGSHVYRGRWIQEIPLATWYHDTFHLCKETPWFAGNAIFLQFTNHSTEPSCRTWLLLVSRTVDERMNAKLCIHILRGDNCMLLAHRP